MRRIRWFSAGAASAVATKLDLDDMQRAYSDRVWLQFPEQEAA